MDPNACWDRLCAARRDGDAGEAAEAAADLSFWLLAGGFVPLGAAAAGWTRWVLIHHLGDVRRTIVRPRAAGIS